MKILNISILIFIILSVSNCGRKVDKDELVLHEMIIEKKGIYYWGDCDLHATKKYSGTDTCYHDNGKIKGTYTILKGLPNGHWKQFDNRGNKTIDLFYKNGDLVKKINY